MRIRWLKSVLAAMGVLLFLAGAAGAGLKDAGALDPLHGFPSWYRDNSTIPYPDGIPLELCLKPAPALCTPPLAADPYFNPSLPLAFLPAPPSGTPENPVGTFSGNFPGEAFYFFASALGPPALDFRWEAGIEGAFTTLFPVDGLQFPFVRIRMDFRNAPPGQYTVRHPYGTHTIAGGTRTTLDIGLRFANPLNDKASTMSRFLLPSATPGGPPAPPVAVVDPKTGMTDLFLANPAVTTKVTNGPFRNEVIVSGPVSATVGDFTLMGKVYVFPAAAAVSPPGPEEFGAVRVGNASAPTTFTLSNAAQVPGTPLTVTSITSGNAVFDLRANTSQPCDPPPFVLPPEGSCRFDVSYVPTSLGTDSGTVTVTTSAGDPVVIHLSGTGTAGSTAVTLKASPAAAQQVTGTPVTFTAAPSGGEPPYEYRFSRSSSGGAWEEMQAFGSAPSWTWNTLGLPAGDYQVKVEMRIAGAGSVAATSIVAVRLVDFTFAVAASPPSPSTVGSPVTFTASAPGESLEYRYSLFANNAWQVTRPFAPSPSWTWTTGGLPPGTYSVLAEVRPAGTETVRAVAAATHSLAGIGTGAPPKSVDVIAAPSSPRVPGTWVTFTAAAVGSAASHEYRFSRQDGKTWTIERDWGSTPSWAWNTAGLSPGKYRIKAETRAAGTATVRSKTVTFSLM